jgi:hypothetical protein
VHGGPDQRRLDEPPGGPDQRNAGSAGNVHRAEADGDPDQEAGGRDSSSEIAAGGGLGIDVKPVVAGNPGVGAEVGFGKGPAAGAPDAAELQVFVEDRFQVGSPVRRGRIVVRKTKSVAVAAPLSRSPTF